MSYSSEVLADSPLAYYRLGESSGTTLVDSSGNGRDGSYVNGPVLGAVGLLVGDSDTAVSFDGLNDYAQVTYAAWQAPAAWTIEAIVKSDALGADRVIASRWSGSSGNRPWFFRMDASGAFRLSFASGGSLATPSTYSAGVTYHVAATYASGTAVLYVDGSAVATGAMVTPHSDSDPLRIGCAVTTGPVNVFDGVIDEVAYYDTVLSGTRILAHYDAATGTPATTVDLAVASESTTVNALTATVGQTINLGAASESTTAHAVTRAVNVVAALGTATETTTVYAVTVVEGQQRNFPVLTETTTVHAITTLVGYEVQVGTATETTTVHAATPVDGEVIALGTATETTTAFSLLVELGYEQAQTDNNADGILFGGTGLVTWEPAVVAPPNAGGASFVTAVAFSEPTLSGFTPFYDTTTETEPRLRQRVVFAGQDVSYFRGVETRIEDYQLLEPFLYGPASVTFPQILGPFESPADFPWLRKGAKVKFQSVDADGNVVRTDWKGVVVTWNPSGRALRVELGGEVRGPADMRDKPLPLYRDVRDAGRLVWRMLTNLGVQAKPRLGVETGIELGEPGGSTYLAALDGLHAQMWTRAGAQWTTMPNENGVYRTARKDRTTVDFTLYPDDAQNTLDIRSDAAEEPNEVFVTCVTPAGMRVNFGVYPGLEQGEAPAFPGLLEEGDTGEDVRVLIRRLQLTRYLNADDGPGGFDDDVVEGVKTLQESAGITESGNVNSTTWDALWDLTVTGYSARWSRIMPAAAKSFTKKWRLSATGSIIELNPNYDPKRLKVSRTVDLGANVTRKQALEYAKTILAGNDETWTGQINLRTGAVVAGDHTPGDPITEILHATAIKPGMNVKIATLGDRLLHVSGASVRQGEVSLVVDSEARDTMPAWQIVQRNRESRRSPERAWLREHRSSRVVNDSLGEWSEVGGVLGQDIYLTGGQWNVVQVPAGPIEGVIRSIRIRTEPMAEFAVAVFGKRISEGRLDNMVPDPLTSDGSNKWRDETTRDLLDQGHILLAAWGDDEEPGGHSPNYKGDAGLMTGKLEDDAGFDFRTFKQPVLYLAVWPDRDTKIPAGRIMWPQATGTV